MFSNIRSLIFKLDPETAHNLAIKSIKQSNLISTDFVSGMVFEKLGAEPQEI